MNILYLLDIPVNSIGGSQKSTMTCIEIVRRNNHDAWLMCPQNEKTPIEDSNTIFFYKKKIKFLSTIIKIFKIWLIINTKQFNIVNAQNPESAMIIGFLKKLKLIPKNTITVFTDRGFLTSYTKQELAKFDWTIKGIDKVICTTCLNLNNWNLQYPKIKTYCINNIVEDIWMTKKINNYDNLGKIHIGFCGRFDEYKRWDTVEEIIKSLSKKSNYTFSITLTSDNKYQEEKMNMFIQKIKKISSVNIFTNLPLEKMIDFYDRLDIFILTSEGESFGRTLIEAMLRKTIVIGTNSGGVPEVIENTSNLFNVGDIEKCIEIVERYKIEDLDKEKEKFKEFAKNKYSKENFEKCLIKIYEDIYKGDK